MCDCTGVGWAGFCLGLVASAFLAFTVLAVAESNAIHACKQALNQECEQ